MRKKILMLTAVLLTIAQAAKAEEKEDQRLLNHVAIGVSAGTDGAGVDVALPVTDFLGVRAGISMMPKLKYSTNVDIDASSPSLTSDEVEIEGKLDMTNFKLLVDIYPFKSPFHITAGAYYGSDKIVSVYNTKPFLDQSEWGSAGIKLGDYRITSDDKGNVQADLKVNKLKPYVGIGVGRAVPKKRINVAFDMGVQFWGTPGIYTWTKDNFGDRWYEKIGKEDIDNDDADKFFDIMSKITVYPVISLRISGRLF